MYSGTCRRGPQLGSGGAGGLRVGRHQNSVDDVVVGFNWPSVMMFVTAMVNLTVRYPHRPNPVVAIGQQPTTANFRSSTSPLVHSITSTQSLQYVKHLYIHRGADDTIPL